MTPLTPLTLTAVPAARSEPFFEIEVIRTTNSGAGSTIMDNYDIMYLKRESEANGGNHINAQGSVLKLENSNVPGATTLTDGVNLLEIVQDSLSTGVPIFITQNAVVSTNFIKVINESTTGTTIWISDGSTSPNTALSAAAGDICLNGDSGNIYRCTGTTNWTAM